MKIAYISTDFGVPIFGFKGASIHVREMVGALNQAGHEVVVLSPALDPEQAAAARTEQVEYCALPLDPLHEQAMEEIKRLHELIGMKTRVRQELRNLYYNLAFHRQALDRLRTAGVDLIYERYALFGHAGTRLARELGVPHILEVNAPLAYEQETLRGLEMKELARQSESRVFTETDRVIVVSHELQRIVASCGVPEERILMLPNAVDPGHFSAMRDGAQVRERHQLGQCPVIGFVGTLKPWHGTETLLDAFRRLHVRRADSRLLIVGDGTQREQLENFVETHQLQGAVTFAGSVEYAEIPRYIAAMDITVAPYTPNESFYYSPIKIFEYMAMAKPVVAGRIGQVEELIADGETGVLFQPGQVAELEQALERLADDPQLCQELGARARAWVETERTWEANAAQVVTMAEELLR